MDFDEIIKEGLELIPLYLHNEWIGFIENEKNKSENIKDTYEMCQSIIDYLNKLNVSKNGKKVALEFYQEYPHKSTYSKTLAEYIASFASYPDNINFLRGYYENFIDITSSEESSLTEKLQGLKIRNEIKNLGFNYDDLKDINKRGKINIDINGQIIPLIEQENELYYGLSDKGEIVIYLPLNEYYDLVYLVARDADDYMKIISRQHKLGENGMISDKTVITDKNNTNHSIENFSILKNPNFYDIKQTAEYFIKTKEALEKENTETIEKIKREALYLKEKFMNEKGFGDSIFDKLLNSSDVKIMPKSY